MDRPGRWWLVAAGAAAMGIAGTYQFAWSSIRGPLGGQIAAGETALGTVLTVFVVCQTVSQFPAGWVRDRYGPRWPLVVAAVCMGAGYVGTAVAGRAALVYLAYGVGGVGAGIAYTVAVNTPVKWFTDRRGLATGVVAVTYGGASFVLIPAIRRGVRARFSTTLYALAALSVVAVLLAAAVLRDPPGLSGSTEGDRPTGDAGPDAAGGSGGGGRAYSWRETLRTRQFWVLYAAFVVVNGVGLMLIGKAVALAGAFDLTPAVATAGASAIAISDAGGVLGGGWLSDRLGAIRTASGSLVLSGLALGAAVLAGGAGLGLPFVLAVGAVAFFRSPTFVIFPGVVGTFFGEARSSENYALLYSSKLVGGVFGGTVASGLVVALGWAETFGAGAALLVLAGLATALVRPVDDGAPA